MATNNTATKERPILFSAEMVRAILDGRKTQTRRVVDWKRLHKQAGISYPTKCRLAWFNMLKGWGIDAGDNVMREVTCPYGQPGDRLWVRETHLVNGDSVMYFDDPDFDLCEPSYGDKKQLKCISWRKMPSIHMKRFASRIDLAITNVRVERVQDISEDDAMREGIVKSGGWNADETDYSISYLGPFSRLWDSINSKREGCSWADNPWVWVIEFERIKP